MIQDLMYGAFALFVIGIFLVVGFVVWDSIDTAIGKTDIAQEHKDFITEQKDYYQSTWDYVFLTLFVALVIGTMVVSYFVPSNPIFLVAILILIVVIGGVCGYLANAFSEFLTDDIMGAAASNFPLMSFIITHYLVFILVLGFLNAIVFFAKPPEAQW